METKIGASEQPRPQGNLSVLKTTDISQLRNKVVYTPLVFLQMFSFFPWCRTTSRETKKILDPTYIFQDMVCTVYGDKFPQGNFCSMHSLCCERSSKSSIYKVKVLSQKPKFK